MDPSVPPAPPRKPLRVWPGVIAVALVLAARFGVKAVVPGFRGFSLGMMWSFGAAALVLLWWLFLSRAPWLERLGAIALMAAAIFGAWRLRHDSMGPLWIFAYALPVLWVALVAGAAIARRFPDGRRRATIAAAILLTSGAWTLLRTEGISGDHVATFGWRWAKSSEERLLAQGEREAPTPPSAKPTPVPQEPAPAASEPPPALPAGGERVSSKEPAAGVPSTAPHEAAPEDWPGFRGAARDGVVRGVKIRTDWTASPPVELWRRPVGPGWSSFAVQGGRIYTQEQRGEDEVVTCYDEATGAPVWTHRDRARFFESNAGAGPRATPTLADGRVYTLGGTGILNALDAATGAVVWSRHASSDSEGTPSMGDGGTTKVPDWGFAGSPLVVGDLVVVAVAGQLIAYDVASGTPRWTGPAGGVSYSSPHLVTMDGVEQVLLVSGAGLTSVSPPDGRVLWQHKVRGFPIVQPALTGDGDVLFAAGNTSTVRLGTKRSPEGWTVAQRWASTGFKPYFNDFVVHKGHVYGFDGRILACVDVADGERKWKGGRYGNGQLVLLPDQDLLLVLSEDGELALVAATSDAFRELARFPAIEGKTWNHPVLAGDTLLVRNAREMAAFRLALADR
jgi:outer membrane protein assembly factor BamB